MKCLALLACLIVASALAPLARADGPLLISIGPAEGAPGTEVAVPVNAKGVSDLGALQFRLTYDPAVLEGKKVERGPAGTNAGIVDFNFGQEGRAGIGLASTKGLTGDGVLLTVVFTVRGSAGQSCPLKLDAARAWDATNVAEALTQTQDGSFTVSSPASSHWIWAAVVGSAILLLVILVIARSRRSRRPSQAAASAR
jgi:hypothetical protein